MYVTDENVAPQHSVMRSGDTAAGICTNDKPLINWVSGVVCVRRVVVLTTSQWRPRKGHGLTWIPAGRSGQRKQPSYNREGWDWE